MSRIPDTGWRSAALLAASLGLSTPALAQAPAAPTSIEEIVVTARKTEENLQEVPIAVTALSGEALRESSLFNLKDLQLQVPNLTMSFSSSQSTSLVFQSRGQVERDILGTLDPPIGFYEDGVYVARPRGANVAFVDVASVQALRGPQGTLFGRNTTGGAILLNTNDPDFDGFSGSVGATVGSFSRRSFTAMLNVPLLEDMLALRFVGQTLRTDGYGFDRTNDRDIATEVNDVLRAKLLFQPFTGMRFVLKAQHIEVDQLGLPVQPVFALKPTEARQVGACCLSYLNATAEGVNFDEYVGGDPDEVDYDEGLVPRSEVRVRSLDLTATWDVPWATLKLIAGGRENADGRERTDIDGTPAKIIDGNVTHENVQQSYELQATGAWFDERLSWAAGGVFFDESGFEGSTAFFTPTILAPINPILTPGDIDNRSAGAYLQGTYSITPKLRATAGVRYSWDEKRLVIRPTRGGMCAIPEELRDDGATCKATFDDSWDDVSYLAGADYRLFEDTGLFDDVLVYASVTTGYRSGGQNLRGTTADTLAPFDPETLMQFEAGFKSELLSRRLRFNAAGFFTLYDDIQRSTVVAASGALPATVVSNAAEAEIAGAELEATALPPIDGLVLAGSLGIVKPSYKKFRDAFGDRADEKFDLVPELTYSLSGGYTREVFGVPWSNRLDWSWTDDVPFGQGELRFFRAQGVDLERAATQPALGILNARSAVAFANGFELGLYGRNLTDERTFASIVFGGGPDIVQRSITNAPREIGFEATYRF